MMPNPPLALELTGPGAVIYALTLFFFFGACIGSFLNVCIYRIPIEQSVVSPRSHCPHCNTLIRWFDNLPILSYLLLRGACRHCGKRISPRYALVELLVAILFTLAGYIHALAHANDSYWLLLDPRLPVYWLAIAGLTIATFVDLEHYIIPDRISLGGVLAGLVISASLPALHQTSSHLQSLQTSLLGAVVGGGSLWLVAILGKAIFKQEAMGMGDVKLMAAIGAFFGWQSVLFTIIVSSFAGSLVGITMILARKKEWQSRLPYGPYIALAATVWVLGGASLWQGYVDWVYRHAPP